MFYIDNVLIGPFRIFVLFFATMLVHQIVTKQPIKNYDLDYILKRTTIYGSAILLLIFILVQLKMYDVFTLISIFFLLLVGQYLIFGKAISFSKRIDKKRKSFLLGFFKFMENNLSIQNQISKGLNFKLPKKYNVMLIVAFFVSFATLVSRYLFLKNDLYTLSGLWIRNLESVKKFNINNWFSDNITLLGENALISFYSKITGISEEMAVHSFGLLEVFGLSIVLYWILVKITKSKFTAPMVGVMFFAFFYKYMPININFLLEHNPLYIALWFALPAMLYTIIPKLLSTNKKRYFWMLFITYMALSLTNLFVALLIVPLFLLISLILSTKKTRPYVGRSILSYVLATVLIMILHAFVCWVNHTSFLGFLRENMILVDAYAYFPQLIISTDDLILIYLGVGCIAAVLSIFMTIKKRKKWTPMLAFILFFNAVILLKWIPWEWIDMDLYFQALSVFLVLLVGITSGIIVYYFKISIPKKPLTRSISLGVLFLGLIMVSFFTNGSFEFDYLKKDQLKTDILLVYDDLSSNYMPFSYAVVNASYGQNISASEHYFVTYHDFVNGYARRDSIFQSVKENKAFLKNNPSVILPHSVFVFIAKKANNNDLNALVTPQEIVDEVEVQISILKVRGRTVNLYYENEDLKVYEIVNKPNSSKLDKLIFEL